MRTLPSSAAARRALALVHHLQAALVARLEQAQATIGVRAPFVTHTWERDEGRHGGGERLGTGDTAAFDRASVNTSCVHYDDLPERRLAGATALSAIVHPRNPHAPSVHVHISYTELRDAPGSWRIMADLNPSIPYEADRRAFAAAMAEAAGPLAAEGAAQGDRYFAIPALGRTRGVTHFYLEGHRSADPVADEALALKFGEAVVATYGRILEGRLGAEVSASDREAQLAYHTLYLFQVLTLDRGTTSGLLVHDQNDVGILGSLPSRVRPHLLTAWKATAPEAQGPLIDALVDCLPGEVAVVTDEAKVAMARAMRAFYRACPEAIDLQARGDVVPPTVANHR